MKTTTTISRGNAQNNLCNFVIKMAEKYTSGKLDLIISTMYNEEEYKEYKRLVEELKNSTVIS